MKRRLLLVSMCIFACFTETIRAETPRPDPLWNEVAASDYILKGRLHVPKTEIKNDYLHLKLKRIEVLKTDTKRQSFRRSVSIKHYVRDAIPSEIRSLDNKDVIVFLVQPPKTPSVFLGYGTNSALIANTNLLNRIKAEVAQQRNILQSFPNSEKARPDNYDERVKKLIEGFFTSLRRESFAELERLGTAAAPAMIRCMDDRRPIEDLISLSNKSAGAFEAVRHYRVANVLQALDAILGQITDTFFAPSFSESSGNAYEAVSLGGWRLYLLYGFADQK